MQASWESGQGARLGLSKPNQERGEITKPNCSSSEINSRKIYFALCNWEPGGLLQNRETGNPENSWGGCWEECCENSGCWRECWRGCCLSFVSRKTPPSQHSCQHSVQHPEFPQHSSQHSSQHPPQIFLGFPVSLFCSRLPGSQLCNGLRKLILREFVFVRVMYVVQWYPQANPREPNFVTQCGVAACGVALPRAFCVNFMLAINSPLSDHFLGNNSDISDDRCSTPLE